MEIVQDKNWELLGKLKEERDKRKKNKTKKEIILEQQIVENNIGLVKTIAKQFERKDKNFLEVDDLINEGIIGLYSAIEKYDLNLINPDTNIPYKFSSYAYRWIKLKIVRYLQNKINLIRIPVHLQYSIKKNINSKYTKTAKLIRKKILSLDQPISKDTQIKHFGLDGTEYNPPSLGEFIPAQETLVSHEELISKLFLSKQVEEILETLSDREEEILRMRYGIDKEREYTFREIGNQFGISYQFANEIEKRALKKLRDPSKSRFLIDYFKK